MGIPNATNIIYFHISCPIRSLTLSISFTRAAVAYFLTLYAITVRM